MTVEERNLFIMPFLEDKTFIFAFCILILAALFLLVFFTYKCLKRLEKQTRLMREVKTYLYFKLSSNPWEIRESCDSILKEVKEMSTIIQHPAARRSKEKIRRILRKSGS